MKIKTFNQYYDFMLLHQLTDKINTCPYRQKHIKFAGDKRTFPIVNLWLHERGQDAKFKDVGVYKHFDLHGREVDVQRGQNADVYIHTAIHTVYMCAIEFTMQYNNGHNVRHSFLPRSNQEITRESIISQVFEYINKHLLFPYGYYGRLQRAFVFSKQQLIEFVKRYKPKEESPFDFREWVERKYRLLDYDEYFTDRELCAIALSRGKQEKLTKVAPFPDIRLPYYLDGDIDEAEQYFWEEVDSLNKDIIFI